ncbi:hypothetical protein Hanom_Chr06g00552991 [Helianthus anomalus]
MSTDTKPASTKKRKSKSQNPPGPNQAVINRREEELINLIQKSSSSFDRGEGNIRLLMSKFVGEVLTGDELHISQINALGLPRITHFEFICRAQWVEPTFKKFNVFYFSGPPKSLHDWKQKFFYIHRGVIPIDMHYRTKSAGVPRVNVSIAFADEEWYKTLTWKATPMIQLEERALVAAGKSMLWVPQNPRAYPMYAHKGRGYSLMNAFDPKVAGGMAVVVLPEGELGWVARIRNNFLHPSNESMAICANELILLLSDESAGSSHDLIHRPSRVGPQRGLTQEPTGEGVSTPPVVDLTVVVAEQKEARLKKREEKKTKGEKTAEELVSAPTHAGVKRSAPDPDDDVTLTEMLAKKQKLLEDKKRELDAHGAAVLSEKKLKFMGETLAPSESEVDLGVFSKKSGNLPEKIFKSSSTPRYNCLPFTATSDKSMHFGSKIDISKITPPTSPPPVPFDVSPPHPDPKGKGKEGNVEGDPTKKVVQSVAADAVVQERGVRVEGAETDWESSEPTPQGIIYTKRRPPTLRGWIFGNYREFYSLSLPPTERLFQKNHHRLDLLDDLVHSGVNLFSTTQEIVRDWQSMGEDILEFEAAKKEFAAERESVNSEKKGLLWRVANYEEKLAKEKEFNANHQKEWVAARERSNHELKSTRDEVVRLKAEKAKDSQEYECLDAARKEKEVESQACIAALEKTV